MPKKSKKNAKEPMPKFMLHGMECRLKKTRYSDGHLAVIAMCRPTDTDPEFDADRLGIEHYDPASDKAFIEEYAVISVNVPQANLDDEYIAVKNWTENEGVLEELIAQKLVEPTDLTIPSGFVKIPVCKLLF